MIYKTNFMEKTFESIFIYEDYLGSYLICKSMPYDVRIPKMVSMNVSGEFIDINVSDNNDYYTKKIRLNGECVYIFYKEKKDENITYLSLSELDFKNTFIHYKMVLYYLSKIAKLPNGNFIVGNVEDYIMAITELNIKYKDKEPFYRGHYSYTYELTPSLYRNKNYFENESFMYMDFKTQFYNELRNKKYIEILTTMQHYKMPTRLLDTTSNPLVALFMACDKPQGFHTKYYGIGEVIYMSIEKKNIKYSDSNAVTLLSSLAVLETKYKQELYEKIIEYSKTKDESIYKNSIAYKRFVAEVQNELAYFDDVIRNLLRGDNFHPTEKGYCNGAKSMKSLLKTCLMGKRYYTSNCNQLINYVSCHDDYTLYDKFKVAGADLADDILYKQCMLAAGICFISKGTPLILNGEEFARTKVDEEGNIVSNSYKSSDFVNAIDWNELKDAKKQEMIKYYKALIAFKRNYANVKFEGFKDGIDDESLLINGSLGNKRIVILINPENKEVKYTLSEGTYNTILCSDSKLVSKQYEESVTVPSVAFMVLERK